MIILALRRGECFVSFTVSALFLARPVAPRGVLARLSSTVFVWMAFVRVVHRCFCTVALCHCCVFGSSLSVLTSVNIFLQEIVATQLRVGRAMSNVRWLLLARDSLHEGITR